MENKEQKWKIKKKNEILINSVFDRNFFDPF